jgi:hypothetical protein
MAYCPNCKQNVSIVTETATSYEEVQVKTDRFTRHSDGLIEKFLEVVNADEYGCFFG